MKIRSIFRLISISSLILLASCTKTPDVRLTLCQDLAQLLLNSSTELQWESHKSVIKGYQDLEMQIQFSTSNTDEINELSSASCFYAYEQDDIQAETFATPTAAYSTYPNKMILKGQPVDKNTLSLAVNRAMLQQGKRAVKQIKENINKTHI